MNNLLSRRSLLLRSAAALAGARMAGITALWGSDLRSKPGVQMYMVAADYQKDPAGTLAKLAAIGYGYVEAFTTIISNARDFRTMLANAGLGCPSAHLFFGAGESTEKLLDEAGALGVHYVVSPTLPPEPPRSSQPAALAETLNHMTADDFRRVAALANRIGESARKRGLEYAYHNHNFEFRRVEGGATGYEILLRETDPQLVKLEVDAGWMAAGGADPVALIRANAQRVRLLHFKDFSTVTPPLNDFGSSAGSHIVDLGTGVAPLKPAYQAARQAGARYFIVDHDPPFHGQTTMQAAKVDYKYVAGLLAS